MKPREDLLPEAIFHPCDTPAQYNAAGSCWRIDPGVGSGYYWIYARQGLYYIKIHDFSFHEDAVLSFDWPEALSITMYDSISGEELSPYRRLTAGCVKTFVGGTGESYKLLIHGRIPIRSVGIEITPAYCREYLQKQYPDSFYQLLPLFQHIDQTVDFPEMEQLLRQTAAWRGDGMAAALFYESKVMEAIRLIAEYRRANADAPPRSLADEDRAKLEALRAYMDDHYAYDIPQAQLTRIACMGATKLKVSFRQMYGCTITEYIQHRRMAQAEQLLARTDLSIGQIAQSVGYASASRFSALFRRDTGMLPSEYRRIMIG